MEGLTNIEKLTDTF